MENGEKGVEAGEDVTAKESSEDKKSENEHSKEHKGEKKEKRTRKGTSGERAKGEEKKTSEEKKEGAHSPDKKDGANPVEALKKQPAKGILKKPGQESKTVANNVGIDAPPEDQQKTSSGKRIQRTQTGFIRKEDLPEDMQEEFERKKAAQSGGGGGGKSLKSNSKAIQKKSTGTPEKPAEGEPVAAPTPSEPESQTQAQKDHQKEKKPCLIS